MQMMMNFGYLWSCYRLIYHSCSPLVSSSITDKMAKSTAKNSTSDGESTRLCSKTRIFFYSTLLLYICGQKLIFGNSIGTSQLNYNLLIFDILFVILLFFLQLSTTSCNILKFHFRRFVVSLTNNNNKKKNNNWHVGWDVGWCKLLILAPECLLKKTSISKVKRRPEDVPPSMKFDPKESCLAEEVFWGKKLADWLWNIHEVEFMDFSWQ